MNENTTDTLLDLQKRLNGALEALPPVVRMFIRSYLDTSDFEASKAVSGISPIDLENHTSRFAHLVSIHNQIAALYRTSAAAEIDARTRSICETTVADLVDSQGNLVTLADLKRLPRSVQHAIMKIKTTTKDGEVLVEYELADKLRALDLRSKNLGLQVTKTEVSGKDGSPVQITLADIARLASEDQ